MRVGCATKLGYILLLIGGIIVFASPDLAGSIIGACVATTGYVMVFTAIIAAIRFTNNYLARWNSKLYGRSSMNYLRILWRIKLFAITILVYPYIMGAANYFGQWNNVVYSALLVIDIIYIILFIWGRLYNVDSYSLSLEEKADIYHMINIESSAILYGQKQSLCSVMFPWLSTLLSKFQ